MTAATLRRRVKRPHVIAALWLVAVAGAVLLVLGPGWLWGTKGSKVAAYIDNVDRMQGQMAEPLNNLLTAYASVAHLNGGRRQDQELLRAEKTLGTVEKRLAAVPAPPAAAKLRRLILTFVRAEDGVAAELEQLARFAPEFRTLVAAAAKANGRLGHALAAVKQPKAHMVRGTAKQIAAARAAYTAAYRQADDEQADAVDTYDMTLAEVLHGLERLHPPPVIAPTYRAESLTLRTTMTSGAALAAELRRKNPRNVEVLARRFDESSRLAGSEAAQRAEISAVKAYNAHVRSISRAESAIRSEVARLQVQS